MNKVILLGRLVRDPDLKFATGTGKAITRFTVAVNRQMKKDEADFIGCIAFGKTGETIAQYMTKGSQIALIGNIRTGSYDKDGEKRYSTDIIVENFEFISSGKKEENKNANNNFENANNSFDNDMMPVDGDIPF